MGGHENELPSGDSEPEWIRQDVDLDELYESYQWEERVLSSWRQFGRRSTDSSTPMRTTP
ncbi:hypothetical protein [Haloplanus salilacus]|uniref:hypothetical protein n=1 Tax=Haloplanus salilacus TaxID=2949994 RepID=UPI0030CAB991